MQPTTHLYMYVSNIPMQIYIYISLDVWFLRYVSGQTDRQTDRYADSNTPLSCWERSVALAWWCHV